MPSGWSEGGYMDTDTEAAYSVVSYASATGGKLLRYNPGIYLEYNLLLWDSKGSYSDQEILTKARFVFGIGVSGRQFGVALRWNDANTNGYIAEITHNAIRIRRFDGSVLSAITLGNTSFSPT